MTVSDLQRKELDLIKLALIIFAAGSAYQRLDDIGDKVSKIESRLVAVESSVLQLRYKPQAREFGGGGFRAPKDIERLAPIGI